MKSGRIYNLSNEGLVIISVVLKMSMVCSHFNSIGQNTS